MIEKTKMMIMMMSLITSVIANNFIEKCENFGANSFPFLKFPTIPMTFNWHFMEHCCSTTRSIDELSQLHPNKWTKKWKAKRVEFALN